jgi:membrane protein implicated in regulation of membrane protease activity
MRVVYLKQLASRFGSPMLTTRNEAITMKLFGRMSFAISFAIWGGVIAAVVQFLMFEKVWRSVVVFGLTATFAYFLARRRLERMDSNPNCTLTEFFAASKNRRLS